MYRNDQEENKLIIPCNAKDMENRKLMKKKTKENELRLLNLENPTNEEKEELKHISESRKLKFLIHRINYWLEKSKHDRYSDEYSLIDLNVYNKESLNEVFNSLKEQGFKIITESLENQADITW